MNKLLLIDGNSLTYRAFYGSAYGPRGILKTSDETPINAVLTLNKMLEKAFRQYKPTHLLIAFDAGPKTFRHEKLDSYKAGRRKTPEELIVQFPLVKEMITKMGIVHYEMDSIEADDIIATLAKKYASNDTEVVVMSSDRDLFQLVDKNISVAVPQNGNKANTSITIDNFFEIHSYNPNQVKDIKGLVGDSSDNLPGVVGIGPKGAVKLISKYHSLENIYENIEEIKGSIQTKLIKDKKMALLCKEIATLKYDVEVPYSFEKMIYEQTISDDFKDFLVKYELFSLIKQYDITIENKEEEKIHNPKEDEKDNNEQINFDNLLFK